jgi:hypothetical protein
MTILEELKNVYGKQCTEKATARPPYPKEKRNVYERLNYECLYICIFTYPHEGRIEMEPEQFNFR